MSITRAWCIWCTLLLLPSSGTAQPSAGYGVTTIAGVDWSRVPDGQPATHYRFTGLSDVALGPAGEIYIVEAQPKRVRRIDANGTLSTVLVPDLRPSVSGRLVIPKYLAVDAKGDVLISDTLSGSIRSLHPDGTVATIVKQPIGPFRSSRGKAAALSREPHETSSLRLSVPAGLASAVSGDVYLADSVTNVVWRLAADGTARVVAGNGQSAEGRPRQFGGKAIDTSLDGPTDVAVDRTGNLYISERSGTLLRVTPQGRIAVVATPVSYADTSKDATRPVSRPSVEVDASGDVLFSNGATIWKLAPNGQVCRVLTTRPREKTVLAPWCGAPRAIGDGYAVGGFAIAPDGTILFVDEKAECLFRVALDGGVAVVAGRDLRQRDFTADDIEFDDIEAIALRGDGALLIADGRGISLLSGATVTRLVPGWPTKDFSPHGILTLPDGSIVYTNEWDFTVEQRTPDGRTSQFTGVRTSNGASLNEWAEPSALARGPDGSIYVADTWNNRIVRIGPDGKAVNFAGTGSAGYKGDDGPAIDAEIGYPKGLAVDANGVVYIADSGYGVIRRVDAAGTITTFSGGLKSPTAVLVDGNGLVIVADTGNDRIVTIERDGTMHVIAGAAKNDVAGDTDDARRAELDGPCALALGTDGTIYFADCGSGRLRKLVPH